MSKTKQSAKEFIQSTFPPVVAIMSSPAAEEICMKNNLTFSELLQPFSRVQMEIHVREPSGTVAVLKELKLSISEWHTRPPQSTLARKYMNESVSQITSSPTKSMKIGNKTIDVPISTPWFELWRDTFLKVQFPLDHEFTKHYLACIIAVSSDEGDLITALTFMNDQLTQSINSNMNLSNLPKWFSLNICKYYVMLHDVSVLDPNVAKNSYDKLKTVLGENNCFLLSINSQINDPSKVNNVNTSDIWSPFITRKQIHSEDSEVLDQKIPKLEADFNVDASMVHPLSPETDSTSFGRSISTLLDEKALSTEDPPTVVKYGELLSSDDLIKIKQLMIDFILKALIPYVESQIHNLTEVIANKKGVSRTLFSATKRWFGTNKPGSLSPGSVAPPTSVIYSNDSQELQLRRLGDLCFMFGLYNLAFQAYHSAKRDFGADSAWLYYAGALEMASLSAYMANIETRKAMEYLEESITCYLNHCKMPQFATRATLLSFEFLKDIGHYGESARQLIRMTSEDSDLRSALLLEQAAYCYLYSSRNMPRKYAFHLILAGHRFSKAKQRTHCLRCYKQAYQVYENSGWSSATDHIYWTIGKHTASLQQLEESTEAMAKLLGPSKQIPSQQEMFLKEYILILQQLKKKYPAKELVLPLPHINPQSIQVLVGTPIDTDPPPGIPASGISFHESRINISRWTKLEEQILTDVYSNVPFVFKPLISLFNKETSTTAIPVAVAGEKTCVNIELFNPMNIPMHIQNVKLQVECSTDTVQIETESVNDLTLAPESTTEVTLSIIVRGSGDHDIHLKGLLYRLCSTNREDIICISGFQTFSAPENQPSIDHRLHIKVIESAPCLQVYFGNVKSTVLSNELQEMRFVLKNVGTQPITRVFVASPTPQLFTLSSSAFTSPTVTEVPLLTSLTPGHSRTLPMWLQAPSSVGKNFVELLFYYQTESPTVSKSKLKYRLLQHTFELLVLNSIECSALACRSCAANQLVHTVNLRVHVKNNCQENEPVTSVINLEYISFFSSKWKLKSSKIPLDKVRLEKQEVSHSLFQAEASNNNESPFSDISLTDQASVSLSEIPFKNFLLKTSNQSDVSNEQVTAISFQGKLVLRWKACITDSKTGHSREAIGQHVLSLDKLNCLVSCPHQPVLIPESSLPLKLFGSNENSGPTNVLSADHLILRKQLAHYSLNYTQCIKHNFSLNKLAIVPVEVKIENFSSNVIRAKLESNIDVYKSGSIHSQLYTPHCLNSFRWIGKSLSQFTLEPGQSQFLRISAAISRPGTYDLQSRILLLATFDTKDAAYVPQDSKTESMLIVEDAAPSGVGAVL